MGNLQDEFGDVNDWVWVDEADDWAWAQDIVWDEADEAAWQELDELPSIEDVLEWQGKGWLWD